MNENKPFFSVIVPVYNVEKYLHRCVDSILAQSYSDFEVLLVDDGSMDKSGTICDEYALKDNRIRVFHQANAGVSAARNKGIDEAKGEYVIFVDSDDYILQTRLLNIKKKSADMPDFVCIFAKAFEYFGASTLSLNPRIYEWAIKLCVVWNAAFRLNIIKENGIRFDESLCHGEDSLFVLDFLCNTDTIVFLNKYDYIYQTNNVGGLNQRNQGFDKELDVYVRLEADRQKLYKRCLLNSKIKPSVCISQHPYFNFAGEVLRLVKNLYIVDEKKVSQRIKSLKLLKQKLIFNSVEKTENKSDAIILVLFNKKLFFLLDCFMLLWKQINKK